MSTPRPWAELSPDEQASMLALSNEVIAEVIAEEAAVRARDAGVKVAGSSPLAVLDEIEARAAHPATRGQRRRMIGVQLVDLTPRADTPTHVLRCVAESCGAEFPVGSPLAVEHHQSHREGR